MRNRRTIVIDDEMEKALTLLCDVAMRFSGMHMATTISKIANAMRANEDDFYPGPEDDEW